MPLPSPLLFMAAFGLSVPLAAQDGGAPPQPVPQGLTWREALDKGRGQLAEALGGTQVSAFGDVLLATDDAGSRRLDWGSFELDLSSQYGDNLEAAFAVVTNREATQMPVGFLDWHPFGGTIAPRGRLWVEKGFHIQAGRFDVPFGNDWQFFASKDSVSITRPLTTSEIMEGGYNDVGIRILGNNGTVNFNTFVLRGFGDGRLVGGRLGLTPFGNPFSLKETRDPKSAELGLSYLYDVGPDRRKQEVAWAVDGEARLGGWYLHGEYLERHRQPTGLGEGGGSRGWHLTQEYAWPDLATPTTAFLRYERLGRRPQDPPPGDPDDARIVLGGSVTLARLFQIKAEWQHALEASSPMRDKPGYQRNEWLAQLVVVF